MNVHVERLLNHCGFRRAIKRGYSTYPYGEHLQDCDICQGAEEIKQLSGQIEFIGSGKHTGGAFVGLPEAVHTHECPYWRVGQKHGPCVCGGCELQEQIDLIFGPYGQRRKVG